MMRIEEAIEYIEEMVLAAKDSSDMYEKYYDEAAEMAISALRTKDSTNVTVKPKEDSIGINWHPMGTGCPEKSGLYLVTVDEFHPQIKVDYWDVRRGEWDDYPSSITAWSEMPSPYSSN